MFADTLPSERELRHKLADLAWDVERRKGVATTGDVDRIGDIVEPMGAKFDLPLPLLWHHNHEQPVGEVVQARPTKKNIAIKAQSLHMDEPGLLKDYTDLAWHSVKSGLVEGLSIGFRPIEVERHKDAGGLHFLSWNLFEVSLVTIPANARAQISRVMP